MIKRKIAVMVFVVIAALSCACSLAACGLSGVSPEPSDTVELITDNSLELELGESALLQVSVVDDSVGASRVPSFKSADPTVVTVTAEGLVVSEKVGVTTIEVSYKTVKKTINVKVVDSKYSPIISTNEVYNDVVKLYLNEKFSLNAGVTFKGEPVACAVAYESSDENVATVSASGEITALTQGLATVTISASYKSWNIEKTIFVEVEGNVIVELSDRYVELFDGDLVGGQTSETVSLNRVLVDGVVQTSPSVTWESRNGEVATVSASGVITAVAVGKTVIAARYELDGKNYYGCVYVTVNHMKLGNVSGIAMSESGVLSWSAVPFAASYLVGDGKEEFSTTSTSVDLSAQGYYGLSSFYVIAKSGNAKVDDSNRAVFEHEFKVKSLQSAAQTLDLYEAQNVVNVLPNDFTKDGGVYYAECTAKNITGAYGVNFKKISISTEAQKDYGNSWCKNAMFRAEDIRKYVGSQLSFWAYAEQETTFYYWKMDLYWARTLNAQVTIPAKTWSFVSFTISQNDFDYITCLSTSNSFYYIDMMVSDAAYEGSDYSGISGSIAQFTANKISELKTQGDIDLVEGQKLYYVEMLCGLLSDSEKQGIAGYSTFVSRIAQFKEGYTVLKDMNTLRGIVENSYDYGNNANYSIADDSLYGKVLSVKTFRGGNNVHAVFKCDCSDVVIESTEAVRFSVYNGGTAERNLLGTINGKLNTCISVLKPKTWTEIVIPISDFTANGYYGILNCQSGVEYKVSMIYAVNLAKIIADANKKISEIGTVTSSSGELILAARTATNEVPESVRASITGYATLVKAESDFKALAIEAAKTDETVKAVQKQINDYRSAYGAFTANEVINNLSSITSGRKTVKTAYDALTLFQKAAISGYDDLMSFSSYCVFEDYGVNAQAFSGSAGYAGVIADHRTNVSPYGVCASIGLGGGATLYTLRYKFMQNVPSGYNYVSFAVKNTRLADLTLKIINTNGEWIQIGDTLLENGKTGEWSIITIPMADFIAADNVIRIDFNAAPPAGSENNVWFSAMVAHN